MRPRRLLPISLLALLLPALLLAGCDPSEPDDGDGNGNARCPLQVTEHVTEPTVWDCEEVHVQIDLFVQDHLTIMPGTEVIMSEGTYILVRDDGKLTADGFGEDTTATILFRGEERRKNYWGGITFQTISDDNVLVEVEVADTGATGVQGSNRWAVGVLGGGTRGRLLLSNATISNAGGIGVSLSQGAEIVWFDTNFEDVDDVIVRATFDTAHQVFSGSFDELIRVERPWIRVENGTLDEEVSWFSDVPYRIVETPRIEDDGFLTIESPTVVEFAQDVWLGSGSGRLHIEGLVRDDGSTDQVILTGVEKIPGYWGGVAFQSVSADNVIEHAVIEYAGGRNFNNHTAAVYVNGGGAAGSVSVENSTIRESADIGIWIREGGFAELTNVTFENNAGQNIVDDNP